MGRGGFAVGDGPGKGKKLIERTKQERLLRGDLGEVVCRPVTGFTIVATCRRETPQSVLWHFSKWVAAKGIAIAPLQLKRRVTRCKAVRLIELFQHAGQDFKRHRATDQITLDKVAAIVA